MTWRCYMCKKVFSTEHKLDLSVHDKLVMCIPCNLKIRGGQWEKA